MFRNSKSVWNDDDYKDRIRTDWTSLKESYTYVSFGRGMEGGKREKRRQNFTSVRKKLFASEV